MRLLLFLLFPALELYLLVKVGGIIGAWNMVLWVFASAALGLWAVKAQGREAAMKAHADLAEGRAPRQNFMDSVLLFFGGVLLILPGLISDAVGLLLLLPPFRSWAAGAIGRHFSTQQVAGFPGASRVFFYHSSGFGQGFGGGPGQQSRQRDTFDTSADPIQPGREEDGPRQAVVIDSTAIEITRDDKDTNGGRSGGKE